MLILEFNQRTWIVVQGILLQWRPCMLPKHCLSAPCRWSKKSDLPTWELPSLQRNNYIWRLLSLSLKPSEVTLVRNNENPSSPGWDCRDNIGKAPQSLFSTHRNNKSNNIGNVYLQWVLSSNVGSTAQSGVISGPLRNNTLNNTKKWFCKGHWSRMLTVEIKQHPLLVSV
jgi:hypothetical protein